MASPNESRKKEHILAVNEFNNSKTVEGLMALATLIQTLILMEPRTYPSDPEMGVGIENYEFEYLDNSTISELSNRIEYQIRTYIPSIDVQSVVVEKLKNQNNFENTIGIMVQVNNKGTTETMVFVMNKNSKTSRVVSKIVI